MQRVASPEFSSSGIAVPPTPSVLAPDFTCKVVNGAVQVTARTPGSASADAVAAAAARSDSLLVAPLRKGEGDAVTAPVLLAGRGAGGVGKQR